MDIIFGVFSLLVVVSKTSSALLNNTQLFQLVVDKKIRDFQLALTDVLAKTQFQVQNKRMYEWVLDDILMSRQDQFVVLKSLLANYTLIPQCCCDKDLAIMVEFRVIPSLKYKDPPTKVKQAAQEALNYLETNNYAHLLSTFNHIKEVCNLGIAFYNRTLISIRVHTEYTNIE